MIVTSLLMKKKSLGLKSIMKTLTFQLGFVWEAYLIVDLMLPTEFRQVSLRENVYDFSVGYNAIDKPDILKNHK